MFLPSFFFLSLLFYPLSSSPPPTTPPNPKNTFPTKTPIHKITFGSCNHQYDPQPMWISILNETPDLWIWLGDVVYADVQILPAVWRSPTMEEMGIAYQMQKTNEQYKLILDTCEVIGVWDDHDYGKNDGGIEYADKKEAKDFFLDFLDIPKQDQQYQHEGVYSSYEYGPKGKKVKVLLLDVRYYRQSNDILGEPQWSWLEQEFLQSDAQIHLIGSGSQVLPSDKPFVDKWSQSDLRRFFQLINKFQVPGIIFISGDVHHAEILKFDCFDLDYPLYEITSSGMTHSVSSTAFFPSLSQYFLEQVLTTKFRRGVYSWENFGTIQIDWEADPVVLWLRAHDMNGSMVLEEKLVLDELRYREGCGRGVSGCGLEKEGCLISYGWFWWRAIPKWTLKLVLGGIVVVFCLCACFYLCTIRRKHKVE